MIRGEKKHEGRQGEERFGVQDGQDSRLIDESLDVPADSTQMRENRASN